MVVPAAAPLRTSGDSRVETRGYAGDEGAGRRCSLTSFRVWLEGPSCREPAVAAPQSLLTRGHLDRLESARREGRFPDTRDVDVTATAATARVPHASWTRILPSISVTSDRHARVVRRRRRASHA